MKLYDALPLGNCRKVRRVLSLLGLDYEKVLIALPNQEQKISEHLTHYTLGKGRRLTMAN